MQIREFRMSDFESVTRLWQYRRLHLGPLETREALEAKLQRDADLFLVAERNDFVLAAVVGSWDGRRGYVCNLAVDPLFERMGAGTQLLQEVERRLLARGARELNLYVGRDNVSAQEFFREHGFDAAEDQLLMVKRVSPSA